jgi:hypothetical protein
MLTLVAQTVLGVIMGGAGWWLYDKSTPAELSGAAGIFFAVGVISMIVLAVASLF